MEIVVYRVAVHSYFAVGCTYICLLYSDFDNNRLFTNLIVV